jgi:hypothetical protein
VIELRDV